MFETTISILNVMLSFLFLLVALKKETPKRTRVFGVFVALFLITNAVLIGGLI